MISGILQQLRTALTKYKSERKTSRYNEWLPMILVSTVGVTALVWGVRELKWLQSWELKAYDQMLRSRPAQPPDQRILLVTITEEDLERQKWSLADDTINQLLQKLESYKPRVIGLNLYRPQQKQLGANLQNRKNIITTCLFSSIGRSEIPPPPNFPIKNVGYNDIISDSEDDQVVRRSLIFAHSPDKTCKTRFSFAALVAISYLEKQDFTIDYPDSNNFSLGKTIFRTLTENSGSYKNLAAQGHQILLNYRNPNHIAPEVTLTQVLNNPINPNLVKDKLVIIGTNSPSVNPSYYTPYSASPEEPARTSPVYIHAQTASQIISTVLDGRPLIWYWPDWAELLWIYSWSLVGGVIAWRMRHPLLLLVVEGTCFIALIVIGFVIFLNAGWIPVIPPALSLVITGISVMTYSTYKTQQQIQVIILQVEQQKEAIEQLNVLLKESTAVTTATGIYDQHRHITPTIEAPAKRTGDLVLAGRYQMSKVLASGGFGCTYLAKDTQRPGNPICVVKQLMPARRDAKFVQVARRLFNTEAQILEALGKHQQIPELLAYFEDNQEFYLVQEYIQGHPLTEELPPHRGTKNESFVIAMLKEVLEVLVFVHEHRVIHRDIKPANIIRRDADNRLVLIDFGAVKLMQPPNSEQTELATVAIGTRGYAPPEQFAGHPRLASDIYALGMMCIQALTSIPPHELQPDTQTGNVRWRHRAEVSEKLAAILDKMVCYHFSDRYQSAGAVLQDLKRIVD